MTVVMSFPRKRESRRYLILLTLKKKKRIWIPNQVGDDSSVVIPAKAGIQKVFISFNIRLKNNIDSCLKIPEITENENNKGKEIKHWIPNQVGDDSSVVIPAKAGI